LRCVAIAGSQAEFEATDGGQLMTDEPLSIIARLAVLPGKARQRGIAWLGWRLVAIFSRPAHRIAIISLASSARFLIGRFPFVSSSAKETLTVCYDLDIYPISYDICWFLLCGDLERSRRGLKHLHIIFIPIEDHEGRVYPPGYDAVVDLTSRKWRFTNICASITQLVPGCAGVTTCSTRRQAAALLLLAIDRWPDTRAFGGPPTLSSIYRDLTKRLAAAGPDWGLKAPDQGMRYIRRWLSDRAGGRKPVVVTLRQYGVDVERNSRTADWVAFLKNLDHAKYFPVLVPDTDAALESNPEFEGLTLCSEAAWNQGLRMALYQSAYINLFVNSGPASLCILSSRCRYLLFKITVPGTHLASEQTLRQMGFEPGTTPGFATPHQKWIWDEDRLDLISREFESMVEKIEGPKQRQREVAVMPN
jgi:hypothetical protein